MMKNRSLQVAFSSGCISLVWLIFLMASGSPGTNITEKLLQPWLTFCAWMTPGEMQHLGNISLGLTWVISGLVIYSIIAGATIVSLAILMNRTKETQVIDDCCR